MAVKYRNPLKVRKDKKVVRTRRGRWSKGHSGNPSGLGKKDHRKKEMTLSELVNAIRTEEKAHRKTLLQHLVFRAYKSDAALATLLKKLLPDLKAMEALVGRLEGKMSSKQAEDIRKKLAERFKTSRTASHQEQEKQEDAVS